MTRTFPAAAQTSQHASDVAMTMPALLERAVATRPDGAAFVFPDRRESYSQVHAESTTIARALVAAGVRRGDAVGLLMPNCLDFVHVMFGAAMAGALLVPINSRLAPRELLHVITDSGMTVLFASDIADEFANHVERLYAALPGLSDAEVGSSATSAAAPALTSVALLGRRRVAGMLGRQEVSDLADAVAVERIGEIAHAVTPADPYIMMYTSGTTANPKGCPLNHGAVARTGLQIGREIFALTESDVLWNPLPLFHVSAQAPLVGVVDAAATYVAMTHFSPDGALRTIVDEGSTIIWPAYPTILGPLLGHRDYAPDTFRTVRGVLTVGPPDLLRGYQEKLPYSAHISCYGSTELGGVATMGRLEDPLEERLTAGKPLDGVQIKIVDIFTRQPVPAGEVGVLVTRGTHLFNGYHNDPEKTDRSFDADGWFDTGDLASIDARGNLTYQGRAKDMLKVGGENVGCVEVESYLASHPAVLLAAVVGIPDDKYDEVPVAFVEKVDGGEVTAHELIEFCRAGLAKYKVPREVHFVTEWPMSVTKVQKFKLRDELLKSRTTPTT
ncbi:MAG TPA: class I adenylate-forming enzyme family protein [Jatrophihabitantaceae bacterium]|jgi:fatty-acyl-CoA synthase